MTGATGEIRHCRDMVTGATGEIRHCRDNVTGIQGEIRYRTKEGVLHKSATISQ